MGKYESVKKRPAIKEDRAKYNGVTTGRKKVKIGDKEIEIYNGFQNPEAYEDYQYNDRTYKVRKDVRPALERLIAGAKAEGINIPMSSSFRTYDKQVETYNNSIAKGTKGKAARPGGSRHGFGDAFDFTDPRYNTDQPSTQNYEITPTYKWLAHNAHKYGFVAPHEMYVGSNPEPWHYEYYAEYDPHLQQQMLAQQQPVRPLPINPSVIKAPQVNYGLSLAGNLRQQPEQPQLPILALNSIRNSNEL